MPTVSAAVAHTLARHVTDCFGVMGNGNSYFLDALFATRIRYTAMRHEAGTVAAADAYFRVSKRLAIATATYGPGFTNTITPLTEAVQAQTPLVLVVGTAPTTGMRPWDIEQHAVASAIGSATFTVGRADAAETTIAAMQYALDHRTAVVLAIPYDLAAVEADAASASDAAPVAWPSSARAVAGSANTHEQAPSFRSTWVLEHSRSTISATEPVPALKRMPEIGAVPASDPAPEPASDPAPEWPTRFTEEFTSESASAPPELARRAPLAPASTALDEAVVALQRAQRPLVLAGHGAWLAGAEAALCALAERLGALTATTAFAAGIFGDPRRDPLASWDLGIAGGFASTRAARLIASADVVLVVGARLNQFTMRFGASFATGARIIQVDIADAATHPAVETYVRGDARLTAERLLARIPARSRGWRETVTGRGIREPGTGLAADGRLDPRSVAERLNELLPEGRTVVQDGGHFIGWATTYWDIPAPNRLLLVGTAFQSIGLGMPSAVGAAMADPDATVVLATGDGGALMALADLDTVIRTVPSGVIVVYNDAAYGAEVHQYGVKGLNQTPMQIDEVDFAALARALGARASVVRSLSDFDEFSRWADGGASGVFVLDCRISRLVVAPYMVEIVDAAARAR